MAQSKPLRVTSSIASYIKYIICEAYRISNGKVIFVKYYVLEDEAWLNYQNREEKTTPTDRYFDSETNILTIIVPESDVNTYGISFNSMTLIFTNPENGERRCEHCSLMTNVGKRNNFSELGYGGNIHVFEKNHWYDM